MVNVLQLRAKASQTFIDKLTPETSELLKTGEHPLGLSGFEFYSGVADAQLSQFFACIRIFEELGVNQTTYLSVGHVQAWTVVEKRRDFSNNFCSLN